VNSDDIAVLDTEVVSNHTVHTCATVIQFIVSKDNENSILALLALHKHGIATEELQCLHRIVRERNNGVVIIDGIGNPVATLLVYDSETRPEVGFLHQGVGLLLLLEDGSRRVISLGEN
jgi:hypothetical protein